jgi:hypothetical protein
MRSLNLAVAEVLHQKSRFYIGFNTVLQAYLPVRMHCMIDVPRPYSILYLDHHIRHRSHDNPFYHTKRKSLAKRLPQEESLAKTMELFNHIVQYFAHARCTASK